MTVEPITCVLCDRVVRTEEVARSHRLRFFDDVVICPDCLEGEQRGYGEHADAVRRSLAGHHRHPA